MSIDGMTNIMGKQVLNAMAMGPLPFFLEHFTMDLRRETAVNLREKVLDVKLRLLQSVRLPIEGLHDRFQQHGRRAGRRRWR